ncbi:hypothetical protein [Halovivax cerinus]|uniref:CHAT domain-containing protein n=1 Tax=Halovivax cerinus TaxID=1487865 RepID=A0ABD5NJF6_9EURY|nr:hypothetical protein [Halovivax cerinus]
MAIEISTHTDPHGLRLFDSNEQRRLSLRTDREVEPQQVSSDLFCFPVDTACRIETTSLVLDQRYLANVHDRTGQAITMLEDDGSYDLTDALQFVGLDGPMKVYCRIDAPGTVEIGINSIRFSFDEPTSVEIGARSLHKRPTGRITTPPEPTELMRAVSQLTSALKTESPERSWPTLRGHPPLIELGTEFEVQTENEPLDTGVRIEVPADFEHPFVVAPLSFYLGAVVTEGSTPAIHTDSRTIHLGTDQPFEDDVARTLKHVFFLDCLVRTEGVYRYDLHERDQLESTLPWDLADLYDRSLSERLDAYLSVPYETIEPQVPRWPLTAHVPSTPESVELLPFVVNELGIVRPTGGTRDSIETSIPDATAARSAPTVSRSAIEATPASAGPDPLVRSASRSRRSPSEAPSTFPVVEPDVTDESIEHAWFGDLAPKHGSKATIEGYQNQLERKSRTQHIDILVVCNDARMLDEHDILDETYGTRDLLPFDVTSKFGVSTDELSALLADGGYDFLHYIGHATEAGLECTDGHLDVRTLESVDIGVFFLNACHSYEQGLALSRRGAFGGVATLGDIINEHAVESGASLARLLNLGFPLRGALEIVTEWTVLGDQYLIVGDGSTDIAQSDGGPPAVVSIDRSGTEAVLHFRSYPAKDFQIGSVTSPSLSSVEQLYLLPRQDITARVDDDSLENYLTWTETPVVIDGTLQWNVDLGLPAFLTE